MKKSRVSVFKLLPVVLIASTLFSPQAHGGYVKDGLGKGAKESEGGVKKGTKETTGGVKKGVKEGTGGVKKGVKETGKLFKKVF